MSEFNSVQSRLLPHLLGSTALLSGTALALTLTLPMAALAQQATPLPPVTVQTEPGLSIPLGSQSLSKDALDAGRFSTSDTAHLLDGLVGVGGLSNGGVGGLPVIHGLSDDRVKTEVNGVPVTSACPNHMNSPLSYISPTAVSAVDVLAGITPVSAGGDSIAGTVSVKSAAPIFAKAGEGLHTEGNLSMFYRSNGNGYGAGASVTAATEGFSLNYNGSGSKSSNYFDGSGKAIASSLYETSNQALTAAVRTDHSVFSLQGGGQYVPYEGFPGARMDMTDNHSYFINGNYQGDYDWGNVDARVYWQHVRHSMDFLSDKLDASWMGMTMMMMGKPVTTWSAMHMPMETSATDLGYTLKTEIPLSEKDTLRVGNEFHRYTLDDWWPATTSTVGTMGPNTFQNISNGQRNQLGTYAEWERKWTPQWTTLLGVRNDVVLMDTGNVAGYNGMNSAMTMKGMTTFNYLRDATAFNSQNHAKTDVNFDLNGLARYEPNDNSTFEAGYARKTRSPNLYERYSWSTGAMASSMVTWFNDGNEYVGNLNLKPETANTFSTTAAFHDAARKDWSVKITPYVTYVEDYIGVTQIGFDKGNNVPVLQFVNQDALLYGLDLSGSKVVWSDTTYGKGTLAATLGWVHGTANGTGLYQLMPLNGRVALAHELGGWKNVIEVQAVSDKSDVNATRREPTTPSYALLNLRTGYQWANLRVDFGIENVFNKQYNQPLGGIDYADAKVANPSQLGLSPKGPYGALPGPGRTFLVGMTVKF